MKSKKQQPVKRKYTKRTSNENKEPIDEELNQLSLVCQMIEVWDDVQKKRNLAFIFSKYSSFINQ